MVSCKCPLASIANLICCLHLLLRVVCALCAWQCVVAQLLLLLVAAPCPHTRVLPGLWEVWGAPSICEFWWLAPWMLCKWKSGQCQHAMHQNGAGAPLGRRGLMIVPKTRLCKNGFASMVWWFGRRAQNKKIQKTNTKSASSLFVPCVTMQNLICRKEGAALLWNAMTKVKFSYLLGKYFDEIFLQISSNQTTNRSYAALLSVS